MLPEKKLCTGCGLCSAICPKKCIRMEYDGEGFLYPTIDAQKCISCSLCEKNCPVLNFSGANGQAVPIAIGAKCRDDSVRLNSSSGGAFHALASAVIAKKGIVCAAAYNGDFTAVRHEIISDFDKLPRLMGAKYMQSKSFSCFAEIKGRLKNGGEVMFVSTPCQTAALLSYLGEKPDSLLLVDMICHGVPSQKVWQKYLSARIAADSPGADIGSVNMRCKDTGWSRYSYCVKIDYSSGSSYRAKQADDPYMRAFTQNLTLRPSCSSCPFKGIARQSDLTLADFWGVWDSYPHLDDNKGVSLILIHSEKGRSAVSSALGDAYECIDVCANDAIKANKSAVESSAEHPGRAEFFKKLSDGEDIIALINDCLTPSDKKQSILKRAFKKMRNIING